jgi:MFS superfamily sulfate permease-like transporter
VAVVANAVDGLGKGNTLMGWRLASGAIIIAGVIQIFLGVFKLPKFIDFVPLSTVRGMLAATGIMIMARQIHLAVGVAPSELQGKSQLELIALVPHSIRHMEYHIAIIGLLGLMIMFGWKYLSFSVFKKIPPVFAVLIIAIFLGQFFHLFESAYGEFSPLINPDDLSLSYNASFGVIDRDLLPVFLKFVVLIVIVGSFESLLTVKAMDLLDPFKGRVNTSRDLTAVGAGNMLAGLLGGLPMISEVTTSAAKYQQRRQNAHVHACSGNISPDFCDFAVSGCKNGSGGSISHDADFHRIPAGISFGVHKYIRNRQGTTSDLPGDDCCEPVR